MPALNPLSNIDISLPEIEAAQDPGKALTRELPAVNPGLKFSTPVPVPSPYLPQGTPDNVDINQNLIGDENTGPAPAFKAPKRQGTLGLAKSINAYISQADVWAEDKYKYGRTYSYGAGWKNANFERYYTHPQFSKLGFNPYRNNEALYNENSSWWDDFLRSSHQWGSLFANGFKSAGIGELFGGADDSAEQMEKAMAIGASTKGGIGGFTTNLFLNSNYTVGIIAEIGVENAILAGIEGAGVFLAPESGGTSLAATGAAVAEEARLGSKLWESLRGVSRMTKTLDKLKEYDNAKSFYQDSKVLGKATDFVKWANPFERSTEFATHLVKGGGSLNEFNKLGKTVMGFGSFYRDIREIELTHSEAKMEGASGAHAYHQRLIDEYYAEHGYMPTGKDAEDIYQKSQSVRGSITLANDALIYFTNKITFGKMLKGFPSTRIMAKAVEEGSLRTFEKVGVEKVLEKGYLEEAVPTTTRKITNFLTKSSYLPWTRSYLAGNFSEAIQESGQDIIQDWQKERQHKIDKDPSQAGFWNSVVDIGTATTKQFNVQGFETLMSGFLMGAIAGGGQELIFKGYEKGKGLINKDFAEKMEAAKLNRQERETNLVTAVNELAKRNIDIGSKNSDHFATVNNLSNAMDQSERDANQHAFQTQKDEMETEHFITLARAGRMDLFTDHIDAMLKASDEELENGYVKKPGDGNQIRTVLEERKARAKEFMSDYEKVTSEFKNPHDPSKFNPKRHPELYSKVKADHDGWEEAVNQLLYSITASKRVSNRMLNVFNDLTGNTPWLNVREGAKTISNAASKDVNLVLDEKQRKLEIGILADEIRTLNTGTAEDKQKAKEKEQTLEDLLYFNATLENYKHEVNNAKVQLTPELKAAQDEDAKFRSGAVVKVKDKEETYPVIRRAGDSLILKDKEGRFIRVKKDKLELVKESKRPLQELGTLQDATDDLKEAFINYMQTVAKRTGGTIIDSELEKAFLKVKDFHQLETDSQKLISAINILTNPTYFRTYFNMASANEKVRAENKAEYIKEAFNKFMDLKEENKFLNDLYDIGVFILPEQIEKYKKTPREVDFYDVATKDIVEKDSEKYKQILDVIEKFEKERTKKPTEEKPAEKKAEEPVTEEGKKEEVPTKKAISVADDMSTMPKDLQDELIKKFEDLKEYFATDRPDVKFPYSTFQVFLQRSPEAKQIIEAYNTKNDLKPPVAPETKAGIPVTITGQTRQQLYDLGYSKADVDKMKPAQAQDIVTKQTTKPKAKAPVSDIEAKKADIEERRNNEIMSTLSKVQDEAAFTGARELTAEERAQEDKIKKEINAKYDAELAALEEAKPEEGKVEANLIPEVTTATYEQVQQLLKALNEKDLVVSEDEKNYINRDNPNDIFNRVTNLAKKGEFKDKRDAKRGTIIDDLFRRYINPEGDIKTEGDLIAAYNRHPQRSETQLFEVSFLKSLYNIFERIKNISDQENLVLIANTKPLWGVLRGEKYAGSMDVLAVNKNTGKVYIVDLKTSSLDRREEYAKEKAFRKFAGDLYESMKAKIEAADKNIMKVNNFTKEEKQAASKFLDMYPPISNKNGELISPIYFYSDADTTQQSAYAELLRQRTGIIVSNILTFPIKTKTSNGKNKYIGAEALADKNNKFTLQVAVDENLAPEQKLPPGSIEHVAPLLTEEEPEDYISRRKVQYNELLNELQELDEQLVKFGKDPAIYEGLQSIKEDAKTLADNGEITSKQVNEISKLISKIEKNYNSFGQVQVGDIIIFASNPEVQYEVISKTQRQLKYYPKTLSFEERAITEPEVMSSKEMFKIKSVIKPGKMIEQEPLTPEEQKINSDNVKTVDDVLKDEQLIKDGFETKKSDAQINDEWLEDLTKCNNTEII